MTTPKIQLSGVHKRFGSKVVLDGIDLSVNPGESLVIIGGSGTGKSVMLKSVLGLIKPDKGSIKVDGQETTRMGSSAREAVNRKFGMLFQGAALFDSLKVWENVAFALIQGRGMNRTKAKDIALEKLAKVGLGAEVGELSPSELSGGMQKRVGLARAIAAEPEIIFFDEPTTGLDPIMADVINNLIRACVARLGARVRPGWFAQTHVRPDLAGRVTVSFIISATGAVQTASVANTTLNNARVETCVAGAVRRWTFPAPDGGGAVLVNYPFVLDSQG
jgi:phospholipid/cholesterol/gamma-HCH transport system ATP-binding protein